MSTPAVRLGGVILGGFTEYAWDFQAGVVSPERLWTLSRDRALAVQLGQPLTYEVVGGKGMTVQHVYALEVLPGVNPHQRALRVVDRRWLWPRSWIASSFNVRRATGEKFLVNAGVIENALVQPEIKYAKWSLYPPESGSTPWKALQVLDYVFRQLEQPYRIDGQLPEVEIQDLHLDLDGASALDAVLKFIPGADVWIDEAGMAVVYDTQPPPQVRTRTRDQAPFPFLERKHTSFPGDVQVVSRRALRPRAVHVLFTPEVEMRFNFNEGGTRTRDSNELVNVGFVPDVTLALTDGRTVARGTPLPLSTLFDSWGSFGYLSREITNDVLRKNMTKHGWANFEQEFGNNPNEPPDPVKQQRAAEAARRFRRTYQVDELYMQRLESIQAKRVAILNTETGTYAPAEVYCDWVRRPSYKGFSRGNELNLNSGWAVAGYADLLADAKVCPAHVVVLDAQAGIFDVDPQIDPYGLSQNMLLGYPSGGNLPLVTGGSESNRTGLDLHAQWDMLELSSTFKLAAVMTVVPASPNDLRKFHRVTIQASEAGESSADGPDIYARVFPGVLTARFAWRDGNVGEQITGVIRGVGGELPAEALVNEVLVRDVAMGTAKRVYRMWRDGPLGSAEVDMDPSIKIGGSLSRVTHSMQNGVLATIVSFSGDRKPVEIWPLLDASTRRTILRVLNTGGAS